MIDDPSLIVHIVKLHHYIKHYDVLMLLFIFCYCSLFVSRIGLLISQSQSLDNIKRGGVRAYYQGILACEMLVQYIFKRMSYSGSSLILVLVQWTYRFRLPGFIGMDSWFSNQVISNGLFYMAMFMFIWQCYGNALFLYGYSEWL